jgi:hypothetical protein
MTIEELLLQVENYLKEHRNQIVGTTNETLKFAQWRRWDNHIRHLKDLIEDLGDRIVSRPL